MVEALSREGVTLPASTNNHSGRWGVTFVRDRIVKNDLYKPHTFEELRGLVADGCVSAEVLTKLEPESLYGVAWFNKGRSYTTQVAVMDREGHKRYKKRSKFVERPRSEWVAVPVSLGSVPPASRELVEAPRHAIRDNRLPSDAGRRFWKLSGGGVLRCQDQQAEGLITIDELRSKLVGLEETRMTALGELEALRDHQEHIAQLEADRNALLESYAQIAPDALDSLTSEHRQRFYALPRIEIPSRPTAPSRCAGYPSRTVSGVFVV